MAGSVNKVILIGNLGADPEIRRTQDGRPIANLRIATSESWRDKNSGERKEKTEWHSVVIFNEGLCKVAEQYLKKGSTVYVEGQLQTRKWQDQTGADRYSTEVVLQGFNGNLTMLGGRGDGAGGARGADRGEVAAVFGAARRKLGIVLFGHGQHQGAVVDVLIDAACRVGAGKDRKRAREDRRQACNPAVDVLDLRPAV